MHVTDIICFNREQEKGSFSKVLQGTSYSSYCLWVYYSFVDTSKFRRYDDDTDSDEEDEEANKTTHDSEHELKTGDDSDVRNIHVGEMRSGCENMEQNYYENISEGEIKTSELSQTRSDIEAALETVSEVESDVYYENSAQLGKTVEAVDKPPEDKTAVNQPDLNSSEEFQSDKLYREIPVKDSGFSDENLEIKGTFQESDTHLDENASEHTMHRTLETVKDNNILGIEKEIESTGCDTDTVHTSKAESAEIERLSPNTSENDSKLPSSKFSRFNRKRRNSSGSESDGSDYSDVSSWSTSHQSPFNFDSKPHDNSKSDVSSTPFSQGHISGKELPDNMESESASESDSDSSSSSDESSASSSSSFKSSNEKYEKVTSKTKPASSFKEKSELYKSAEHPHKQNSLRSPEVGSRENEYRKSDLLQRRVSGTGDKKDDIHLNPAEKKESFNSAKVTSGKSKRDEKDLKKVQSDTYFHENSQNYSSGRQIKDKAEKVKQVDEGKSKSTFNRHEDTKYFEQISDKNIKKEPVKQIFPIQLEEDYKTTGIEQIVLDARRQKLGKETRTVSLTGSEQKDTSESTFHRHTESVASKSYDRDDSHHSSMKDKSAVSKDYFDSTKHEKSSRYRKSRSRTPPKAYLKAKNKKTEQKVLKRFGSISPPKAYSKDLKKMEKRRKSSHSGERKRKHSGSVKKTRRSDSKKFDSATDSGKSISSLSDSDSDSETENWRDKKSGVSRKRDDIERERRMRLAAEKETDRKERKESDSVKDRQHKDRKEERYSGRSDGREGKSKTEIDSFDARDYRQQIAWDDRHRSRRDVLDRRPHERVFYRKNKTFVEEEPMFNKTHFEEEVSDDSKHDNKQGIASVIKPNRKRLSSEADLEDIKISRKHSKHKHEDLNKKVKKERLIISVQESSGDEKQTKSEKVRKSDSRKKKSKHKSHDKNTSGESDSVREEQLVKVVFTEGKVKISLS